MAGARAASQHLVAGSGLVGVFLHAGESVFLPPQSSRIPRANQAFFRRFSAIPAGRLAVALTSDAQTPGPNRFPRLQGRDRTASRPEPPFPT